MSKNILTAKEVATLLGVSYWLILDEVKRGKLPHFKLGSRVLFREEALHSWIKQQEKDSMKPTSEDVQIGKIQRITL